MHKACPSIKTVIWVNFEVWYKYEQMCKIYYCLYTKQKGIKCAPMSSMNETHFGKCRQFQLMALFRMWSSNYELYLEHR